MNGSHLLFFVNVVLTCLTFGSAATVLQAITQDPELSTFSQSISDDEVVSLLFQKRQVTVFAPTNAAIEEWKAANPGAQWSAEINAAHFSPSLLLFRDLPISQQSSNARCQLYLLAKENPSTLSRTFSPVTPPKTNAEPEYYVNNAKVISPVKEYSSAGSHQQYLYKIDRVIDSYAANRIPNAWELLSKSISISLTTQAPQFDKFAERIRASQLESLFSESGQHTFLVPVDNAFQELDRFQVQAHVIPNQVLPVRVFQGNRDYPSAMNDSNIAVTISKPEPLSPPEKFNGSKSQQRIEAHCRYSNVTSHHLGTTRTGITLANIPVSNGIIHFIEAPFLVITDSIWDIIEANKDGQLSKFYELINRFSDVMRVVKSSEPLTVFAPSNAAFEAIDPALLNATLNNSASAGEVAKLHFYQGVVSTDIVGNKNYTHSKALDGRDLYYSIAQANENVKVLTVEGGGVNATAVHPDLGARNGRVHIINKVLGIPYQSVYEKLKDDYDLSTTYLVGSRRNDLFNRNLHRSDTKFTYFAPSRDAWTNVQKTMPSEYKQLIETHMFPVHGEQVSSDLLHMNADHPARPLEQLPMRCHFSSRSQLIESSQRVRSREKEDPSLKYLKFDLVPC